MLPICLLAVLNFACASEKPVASADVAPVIAAVVAAVDTAVGLKDSLPIDPRILLRRTMWRRKPVTTAWSESELAATISPRHPRLELGMLAWLWFAIRKGGAWRIVKRTTLSQS